MKNFLFILFCSIIIASCTAKNKKTINNFEKHLVQDSTCCFDIKEFTKKVGTSGDGPAEYDFTLANGKEIRQIVFKPERNSPETEWSYNEEISKQGSPFVIRKKYDYMGRLMRWSTTFRSESINKSYEYDEKGNVIKIINYEEIYKHSFADIREFLLKKKGIDIYDTRQAIARRVNHRNQINPEAYYDIDVRNAADNTVLDYRIVIFDTTLEMKEHR